MTKLLESIIATLNEECNIEHRESLISEFESRADIGFEKYGTTMDRDDLSRIEWERHLLEELFDSVQYAFKLVALNPEDSRPHDYHYFSKLAVEQLNRLVHLWDRCHRLR